MLRSEPSPAGRKKVPRVAAHRDPVRVPATLSAARGSRVRTIPKCRKEEPLVNRLALLSPVVALALASGVVPARAAEKPLMRDFIGINAHTVQFKPELYAPICRLVRDYHPFDWDAEGDTSKQRT